MVMAQSLFMTLKHQYPACQIDVLAPEWTFPLLDRMPEVTHGFAMPLLHGQLALKKRIELGKKFRATDYDQAIVLPNSWKSAIAPFFAGIPVRTGFLGEMRWGLLNDIRFLNKAKLKMTVERFVSLGLPKIPSVPECLAPSLQIDSDNQQKVIQKFDLDLSKQILALCPGAEYGSAKRWPPTHYAEVANTMIAKGWSVWLFGSNKERDVAEQINALTSEACVDFSGRTSLEEAIDLISLVDVAVTNDSGLMHIAAALNKKLIAIYGSTDPGFTPPLNKDAHIINLKLACSPCFKRTCPLGHTKCLTDIVPQQVLELIET